VKETNTSTSGTTYLKVSGSFHIPQHLQEEFSHSSWDRDYLCKKVTWRWVHQILQFRVITLSFTIYIHKSHSTSDTSLELFFKLRVEHKHLVGSWSHQLHVVHWDSSTSHYKFLLLVPIKVTPCVLKLNNVINAWAKFHVYWYLGTAIGMNFKTLTLKRGEFSEATYNNILV
jgi:hypothetical protein